MNEFKVGDEFIYFPGNNVCLLRIIKIGEWDENKRCKPIEYKRFTYDNDTYNDNEYEIDNALIAKDEDDQEYVQIDYWYTHKYCMRHIIYHKDHLCKGGQYE